MMARVESSATSRMLACLFASRPCWSVLGVVAATCLVSVSAWSRRCAAWSGSVVDLAWVIRVRAWLRLAIRPLTCPPAFSASWTRLKAWKMSAITWSFVASALAGVRMMNIENWRSSSGTSSWSFGGRLSIERVGRAVELLCALVVEGVFAVCVCLDGSYVFCEKGLLLCFSLGFSVGFVLRLLFLSLSRGISSRHSRYCEISLVGLVAVLCASVWLRSWYVS